MILDAKYVAVIISSLIAALGWLISSYINTRAFRRAEASKLKDKISSQMEVFFDQLEEKIRIRSLKETELDDFITGKLAIIELQIKHLEMKIQISLISAATLAIIRDKPYDFMSSNDGEYKKQLHDLKINTLEEIEEKYTNWYFQQDKLDIVSAFQRVKW
ncbi:TPA: hypothetical protein PXO68_003999 [Yersinia enterocolitica]|uniref:Uncharacterized protein n=2 Tax=Yersinia ruckeri TaxID=29486 RepID=A0A380QSP7_YERRU|nr:MULTISPECIES: hypothetical protein [Yersinia]HDL7602232.1 hypothetical protein [Yersinia enterocolitica]KGA51131.1 hypothetical protein DJ39_2326 [Yersinia ruckeri ATCC 29473]MCK8597500.1 hypothetical protein [Yersinia ruckeri]MCW6610073.1 hypothetical protein [Yersinia ruckeri]MCW6619207.1 hypothetical protein [Yersinia ruckeri]